MIAAMTTKPKPKVANPTDKHVGARVRMRRMMLGMSQETLGEALGLSFQQVQKYEKGANRIGASRLQQIAQILQVGVSFFFEGQPVVSSRGVTLVPNVDDFTTGFLASRDGINLARAFSSIKDVEMRRRIVNLVEGIRENQI